MHGEIFELSDGAVDRVAEASPLFATFAGVEGHDHLWPDLSPDGADQSAELHRTLKAEALAAPIHTDQDRLAQRVLVDYCDDELRSHDARIHLTDLNNLASTHQSLRQVFDVQAADTAQDWEAILTRLETIDQAAAGYQASLDLGRTSGEPVSRRQVEAVLEQGELTASASSSFYALKDRLAAASVDAAAFEARLDTAIDHARSVFADLNDYLANTYLPDAAEADAVGEERYAAVTRTFLGTDLDLRETYRWGWSEVERLWSDLQAVCKRIDANRSVPEVFDLLQTDPARAATSAEEFIAVMKERQDLALANLEGSHFDVPQQIRTIDVQIEPAGGALAAHYMPPSEDFSRPGSVWYPIDGQDFFPLFREITIAYHEGFPGHHLQVGVQASLADELSRFHRLAVWYPGSGEGWALYAEHLMGELGYLEKPDYEAGLLSSQLLRACRVAIDIGVHLELPIPDDVSFHPGEAWNFDLAYELLVTRALEKPDAAHSEVTRYFGWPGQAISYKVGEQAILDLREEHRAQPDFDLKAFHARILSCGSVGLDLLREHMAG